MVQSREELRGRLRALGFDAVHFARAARVASPGLKAWLEAGMHADMGWMERTAAKRLDPDLVLPGSRTVIALGVNYWRDPATRGASQENPAGGPVWARYALNEDYHDTIRPALAGAGRVLEELCGAAGSDYRYYVDTGPVLERNWAEKSGMGFIGKNAMLISRQHGNWMFLAAILTTLEFEPDEPMRPGLPAAIPDGRVGALCGKCTRCLDACPTGAFPQAGVLDARLCISYQTIENKGIIPRELRPGIGNRIYGCDICLEVCPWNRFAREGRSVLLASRGDIAHLTLGELLQLTPERFAEVFRRTPVKRLKLAGLLRNACVVAGNSGDTSLLPEVVKLAAHSSAVVRAHAIWAVFRLSGTENAARLLSAARQEETDPDALAEYAAGCSATRDQRPSA